MRLTSALIEARTLDGHFPKDRAHGDGTTIFMIIGMATLWTLAVRLNEFLHLLFYHHLLQRPQEHFALDYCQPQCIGLYAFSLDHENLLSTLLPVVSADHHLECAFHDLAPSCGEFGVEH